MREQVIEFSLVLDAGAMSDRHFDSLAFSIFALVRRETLASKFVKVEVLFAIDLFTGWPDTVRVFVVSPSGLFGSAYVRITGPVRVMFSLEFL